MKRASNVLLRILCGSVDFLIIIVPIQFVMMGVFGGAIFPVLQGILADTWGSWQWTWIIALICELVMLYYAISGSHIKNLPKVLQS